MARRGIFRNITGAEADKPSEAAPERKPLPGYAVRGASRNMLSSIGELAEKAARADQMLEGAIAEIDPALIDASFVSDRLGDDDSAFEELVQAIRERGQDSPVLLRPHPERDGRYQIVFGHRRVKAARLLERKVRAIIRSVNDVDHIIAQGQENSARDNLSFIERASFAQRLLDRAYSRDTIQSALAIDAPMLTRMLSVSGRVPEGIVAALGACKNVGRDRWLELAQLIEHPAQRKASETFISGEAFRAAVDDQRFDLLLAHLKRTAKPVRGGVAKPVKTKWQPADRGLSAELTDMGKTFAVSFKAKHASGFGRYLAANLDALYAQYKEETGDDNRD